MRNRFSESATPASPRNLHHCIKEITPKSKFLLLRKRRVVREEGPYGGNRSRPFSSMTSRRLIGSLSREISCFPSIISPAKLGHSPRKKLVLGIQASLTLRSVYRLLVKKTSLSLLNFILPCSTAHFYCNFLLHSNKPLNFDTIRLHELKSVLFTDQPTKKRLVNWWI